MLDVGHFLFKSIWDWVFAYRKRRLTGTSSSHLYKLVNSLHSYQRLFHTAVILHTIYTVESIFGAMLPVMCRYAVQFAITNKLTKLGNGCGLDLKTYPLMKSVKVLERNHTAFTIVNQNNCKKTYKGTLLSMRSLYKQIHSIGYAIVQYQPDYSFLRKW